MSIEHLTHNIPQQLRWRRRIIVGAMLLCAVAIMVRLFTIQVLQREQWLAKAERQYITRIRIMPERGAILDRTGTLLATTLPSTSFALDLTAASNIKRIAQAFERAGIARAEELLHRMRSSSRNFLWIARGVPLDQAALVDTLDDPGLIHLRELTRAYVFDSLAAQLLGTTDIDGRGIAGLELLYDSLLVGTPAERVMERVGRGRLRPVLTELDSRAQPGASLQLTLDMQLQHIAEQELARSVATTGARAGIVLALRPQTGEILCCAHQPSFSHKRRTDADALRPRAITDMYEPGSTFKLIVAAAALESNIATPSTLLDGHGGTLRLADGRAITDHEPVGLCTLTEALAHSSNIAFAELALRIGPRQMYRYARDFGFGIRTGIELPGEARGMLKRPAALNRSDLMFMGFGYGIACTPLQLAGAYAAIANGGELMQPYVVERVTAPDGTVLMQAKPQRIRRVITPQTAAQLRSILKEVVERGTGTNARIAGISVAGKTGTAQQWTDGSYSKHDYTASFVGMVPADTPSLVIVVMLDRPRSDIYGGNTAAPLFRRIIEAALSQPALAARYRLMWHQASTRDDSVRVPDVRGNTIAAAKNMLDECGVSARIESHSATGLVTAQVPPPGSSVPRGSTVTLYTTDTLDHRTLIGLPLRQAVALAHARGATVEIRSGGIVRSCRLERRKGRLHVVFNP